jgi:hypothetical protein
MKVGFCGGNNHSYSTCAINIISLSIVAALLEWPRPNSPSLLFLPRKAATAVACRVR